VARLRVVVLALALLAGAASPLRAETLQRLHVTQLVLSADSAQPKLEVPFHLLVTAHVSERVASLDNLDLPLLAELDVLGDEHSLVTASAGTTYRESITVVAHHTGAITVAPVTLDAIDGRNGRPTRFSSNSLTLMVAGGRLEPTADTGAMMRVALRLVWIVLGIGVALLLLALVLRRPRRPLATTEVLLERPVPVAAPPREPKAVLSDTLVTLRAEPTRATAMRVRHVVRAMVGANDTQTLADVLRRSSVDALGVRDVLVALERAAFTYDSDLGSAVARAIAAIEGAIR